jgi:hypothetical protein
MHGDESVTRNVLPESLLSKKNAGGRETLEAFLMIISTEFGKPSNEKKHESKSTSKSVSIVMSYMTRPPTQGYR